MVFRYPQGMKGILLIVWIEWGWAQCGGMTVLFICFKPFSPFRCLSWGQRGFILKLKNVSSSMVFEIFRYPQGRKGISLIFCRAGMGSMCCGLFVFSICFKIFLFLILLVVLAGVSLHTSYVLGCIVDTFS